MMSIDSTNVVRTSIITIVLVGSTPVDALMPTKNYPYRQAKSDHGVLYDSYTLIDNSCVKEKRNIEIIHKFSSNLLENIEDMPVEFSRAIDDNFWDLL